MPRAAYTEAGYAYPAGTRQETQLQRKLRQTLPPREKTLPPRDHTLPSRDRKGAGQWPTADKDMPHCGAGWHPARRLLTGAVLGGLPARRWQVVYGATSETSCT